MKVLVKEKLSEHKYKTPEGYLICVDAILARTGKQTYRRDEIFHDSDDTEIEVDRTAEEVFSPQTLASFENKPITVEHPSEDVNSGNYKDYSVGFVRDVHQGKVDDQDVILGTLVIQDAQTIEEIENGEHVELSCGYDCDIDDSENPQQRNIRGNHVALCECGRAGNARIVDSANGKVIGDSVESDFEDITNMSDAKELLKRYGIELIKKDNRNYVLRKGSKDYTFYVLDNPNEVRKDLIRAVKKLTMNDSKEKDCKTKDANRKLEEIERHFKIWGYPTRLELQSVVNFYELSKDEAKTLFKEYFDESEFNRLKYHDSIKDSKYIVHFKHKNGGEDKDIVVEAKGMKEAVEIAKTYVSDYYYKYVNVKPHFEDSVKDATYVDKYGERWSETDVEQWGEAYGYSKKEVINKLELKKVGVKDKDIENLKRKLKVSFDKYNMNKDEAIAEINSYKNLTDDEIATLTDWVYEIYNSKKDSCKDTYDKWWFNELKSGDRIYLEYRENGRKAFTDPTKTTFIRMEGDYVVVKESNGSIKKINANDIIVRTRDSYKDYQSTKESFERIEEMPRSARKWVGETSDKKAGLLAIKNGIEDIINAAEPSIRAELQRRGDKILRDIKIQFRIEDEKTPYEEVTENLEKGIEDDNTIHIKNYLKEKGITGEEIRLEGISKSTTKIYVDGKYIGEWDNSKNKLKDSMKTYIIRWRDLFENNTYVANIEASNMKEAIEKLKDKVIKYQVGTDNVRVDQVQSQINGKRYYHMVYGKLNDLLNKDVNSFDLDSKRKAIDAFKMFKKYHKGK